MQLERYRRVGAGAQTLHRSGQRLVVDLDHDVAEKLVDELVAVERECCPFFTLDWRPDRRRLTMSVASVEHEPALDAIALGLQASASGATSD